ncbi:MAG TPA: hypothetical protein VKA67_12025, partial [Verrucomicrobiae bacterium]|nr:hypothetical protein [Verrucomicrobiae bacterium]
MRRRFILALAMGFLLSGFTAVAASGRVVKVLPEFLDLKGRNTVSPSLFERDAYQAYLRNHPKERSGLRFYVEYQAHHVETPLTLRVELRGGVPGELPPKVVLEKQLKSGHWFNTWTSLDLTGAKYKDFGELMA